MVSGFTRTGCILLCTSHCYSEYTSGCLSIGTRYKYGARLSRGVSSTTTATCFSRTGASRTGDCQRGRRPMSRESESATLDVQDLGLWRIDSAGTSQQVWRPRPALQENWTMASRKGLSEYSTELQETP